MQEGMGKKNEDVSEPPLELDPPHDAEIPRASPSSSAQPVRPRRVLVVDDNLDGATMLAAILQLDSHEVLTALSGAEALEIAASKKPDVVLLDIGLPDMDGYEVARHIRAALREAAPALVALTGYGRDEDRERTRSAGFTAHLVKPVDFEALRRTLADLP
jgi:two-component system CheB/CheR fusion protein